MQTFYIPGEGAGSSNAAPVSVSEPISGGGTPSGGPHSPEVKIADMILYRVGGEMRVGEVLDVSLDDDITVHSGFHLWATVFSEEEWEPSCPCDY